MGGREKLLDGVKKTKEGVLSSLVSVQETPLALRNFLATADMFSLRKYPLVCNVSRWHVQAGAQVSAITLQFHSRTTVLCPSHLTALLPTLLA